MCLTSFPIQYFVLFTRSSKDWKLSPSFLSLDHFSWFARLQYLDLISTAITLFKYFLKHFNHVNAWHFCWIVGDKVGRHESEVKSTIFQTIASLACVSIVIFSSTLFLQSISGRIYLVLSSFFHALKSSPMSMSIMKLFWLSKAGVTVEVLEMIDCVDVVPSLVILLIVPIWFFFQFTLFSILNVLFWCYGYLCFVLWEYWCIPSSAILLFPI